MRVLTGDPGGSRAAVFAAVFAALWAAHSVGDHWVQTDHQARTKGQPDAAGWWACTWHVLTLTATKLAALAAVIFTLGLHVTPLGMTAGLGLDALTHWWADRRYTLAGLAALIPGKAAFYRMGSPRPGRDDAPHLGTGAYALDQSFHHLFLFTAALVIAGL